MRTTGTPARQTLIALVGPFIAVALAQAIVASVSLYTLSAVRAYVGGESLWSKGQKAAIFFLDRYTETGDEAFYRQFKTSLAVPLGDRTARLALDYEPVDVGAARRGLIRGGNHPDDVPAMIWLFQTFRHVSYLDTSIRLWAEADPLIVELEELGKSIHRDVANGALPSQRINRWHDQISAIDREITPKAVAFGGSLGEGSRAIKDILLFANIATAAMLIALAVWRTLKMMRQRQAAESALDWERERAAITLSSIGEAVVTTDAAGTVAYMNPTAERLFATDAASGRPLDSLFTLINNRTGERDCAFLTRILAGDSADVGSDTHKLMRDDGSTVAVSLVGAPLRRWGATSGAVLVFHDMTREHEYIERLSWQASHDALTGLANRRAFEERLAALLEGLAEGQPDHALMFLDLDQFKLVNDTCGHAAGDRLLLQVSDTLGRELRQGDVLARLGGDEFGVLTADCNAVKAVEMAERLRKAIEEMPFGWNGRQFNVSVSIGVVRLSQLGTTLEEALRTADLACYMAKEKGRNRVQVHEPGDSELQELVGGMAWVQRIRTALDEDRFCLYGQEIVPLKDDDGRTHVELLLRLRDEKGELVPPLSFIPPAERYGLMPMIDRWVVRNAFAALAAREAEGQRIDVCAINVSGSSFADRDFVDFVRDGLAASHIAPSSICFEITETSAIANLSTAISFIGALRKLGCSFALDDFGSGMSSFAYLKQLPVDYLKIDGGFVRDMLTDRSDRAMVEMIHHVGQVMGKITIAEFVESGAIADALREIGIAHGQGYGIARPKPFDRNFRFVARGTGSLHQPRLAAERQRRIG